MKQPFLTPLWQLVLMTCTLTLSTLSVRAQTYVDSLVLKAVPDSGRVLLRWAPPTTSAFYGALAEGYVVRRRAADSSAVFTEVARVRQWPIDSLKSLANTYDGAALYVMSLFPDSLVDGGGFLPGPDAAVSREAQRQRLVAIGLTGTVYERKVAEAAGLFYADTPPRGIWEYEVAPATIGLARPSRVRVDSRMSSGLLPLSEVRADWSDKLVTLRWNWPPDGSHAYMHIQRRTLPTGSWEMMFDEPLLGTDGEERTLRDSLPNNQTRFAYRLYGYDYFGRRGPYSPTVEGHGLAPNRLPAPYVRTQEVPTRQVEITWTIAADEPLDELAGLQVLRGLSVDGAYRPISAQLPPSARRFRDSIIVRDDQYYKVVAVDKYGRTRAGAPAHFLASDTIAPAAVRQLAGRVDSAGIVRFGWAADSTGEVYGYRVFRASSRRDQGVRLTSTFELVNQFTDTLALRSLRDSVYYRVVALDDRSNASEFSDVLALAIPDVHPPSPPMLINAVGDTAGVSLRFRCSIDDDVVQYTLERRLSSTTLFYPVLSVDATGLVGESRLVDSTGIPEMAVEYRLVAYDRSGLRSVSNIVSGVSLWNHELPAVVGLSAKPDPDARATVLTWRYQTSPQLRGFRVWRALGTNELTTYEELQVNQLAFRQNKRGTPAMEWRYSDDQAALGQPYDYAVQALWADGTEGKLGDRISL